jgi:rhamnogalacturonyl hydrolase YesR
MLVYALNEGVDAGHVDASYRDTALTAWNGLVENMVGDDSTGPIIQNAAQGMSIQRSYADYVGIARLSNSYHGLCAIQLAAASIE